MYRKCIVLLILLLIFFVCVRNCMEMFSCVCFGLDTTDKEFAITENDKRIKDIDVSNKETFKVIIDSCEHHRFTIQLFPNEGKYKARIIK